MVPKKRFSKAYKMYTNGNNKIFKHTGYIDDSSLGEEEKTSDREVHDGPSDSQESYTQPQARSSNHQVKKDSNKDKEQKWSGWNHTQCDWKYPMNQSQQAWFVFRHFYLSSNLLVFQESNIIFHFICWT